MNPTTFRWFPLIARPRPACTPLIDRVAGLQKRAVAAAQDADAHAAASVFNLAALLASDCGDDSLARAWCHRLANLTLRGRPGGAPAIGALEPIVNLARLHTRAGDGLAAWTLLEALHTAVDTRTDTTIDGLTIPASRWTSTPAVHRELRRWTWKVLLGSGGHALAVAGRWDEARQRLSSLNGVGRRMLDGRQITVIAHILAGRREAATAVLNTTQRGEPWEQAVTACLQLLHQPTGPGRQAAALATYQAMSRGSAGLAVFRTRLGLKLADALAVIGRTPALDLAAALFSLAAGDGYAARDVLGNDAVRAVAGDSQLQQLREVVHVCGLGAGRVPTEARGALEDSLAVAEQVISPADAHSQRDVDTSAGRLQPQPAQRCR